MSLAWISIAALAVAVLLSCFTTINVGLLSLAMAMLVGVYLGGMSLGAVLDGFPVPLLVTLISVTLLFSIAECNGTLARVTARAVGLCRGHAGLLPVMFFVLGFAVATIGAGATPASALLAGPAMAVAWRAGVPLLLMAIMTGNGALAGTLSPFAPTGIVAHGVMSRIGLGGVEWQTFAFNALAHTVVGVGGVVLFGGWRLFRPRVGAAAAEEPDAGPMEAKHWLTASGIALLIVLVAGFGLDVGMIALFIAVALILLRTVDEQKAIKGMVPDLATHLGVAPLPIAWSMNVSASLVDLSPLSTVGALYIAGAPPGSDARALFNGLLVWGLSMAVVGAALCWILFGFR